MFESVANVFWFLLLSVAVMAIILIPGKDTISYSYHQLNGKEYICPEGFKMDDNLTCYKTYKAKEVIK